jgi:hypothetical protein
LNNILYKMFLQAAFYISLYLFAASITAAPLSDPDFDDSHLPGLRLSLEEVQAMKESQSYPPGYIHENITLGEGSNAVTVPVVEVDPNILLDDADGLQARSLVPRSACLNYGTAPGTTNCLIIYCWIAADTSIKTQFLNLLPGTGKNPGKADPQSLQSNDINYLYINPTYNNGYNHWFPKNHACSNDDTIIYTNHYFADDVFGVAYISNLACNSCVFQTLGCLENSGFTSYNNLQGWSSRSGARLPCQLV